MATEPTVTDERKRGPRGPNRLGKKLKRALQHLTNGRPLAEAATLAHMSPQGLRLALRRPQLLSLMSEDARARLTGLLPKAVSTVERVMDSSNMQAALNGARFVAGVHSIAPPERGTSVSVNVDVKAGFVIDLSSGAQAVSADDVARVAASGGAVIGSPCPSPPRVLNGEVIDGDAFAETVAKDEARAERKAYITRRARGEE